MYIKPFFIIPIQLLIFKLLSKEIFIDPWYMNQLGSLQKLLARYILPYFYMETGIGNSDWKLTKIC